MPQLNAIGFDDKSSEDNLRELVQLGQGHYRFVELKEYAESLFDSPIEACRLAALKHFANKALDSFESRSEYALETLIPGLHSNQRLTQRVSESLLHELSLSLFTDEIQPIDFGSPDKLVEATEAWKSVWELPAVPVSNGSVDAQKAIAELSSNRGLLRTLASGGQNPFKAISDLDLEEIPQVDQIQLAQYIVRFQKRNPREWWKSIGVLANVLEELNKNTGRKFNRDSFLKYASVETCERKLDKVLADREESAGRIFRKWSSDRRTEEERIIFARELIENFPETKWAIQAKAETDIPVTSLPDF